MQFDLVQQGGKKVIVSQLSSAGHKHVVEMAVANQREAFQNM